MTKLWPATRRAIRLGAILVCVVAVGAGLLAASALLPADTIRANASADPKLFQDNLGTLRWLGSTYTLPVGADALRLNISLISADNPIVDSFAGAHYTSGDNPTSLIARASANREPNSMYPRYWHGYVPATRLALTLMTYSQWRTANAVILSLLMLAAAWLSGRRGGWVAALMVVIAATMAVPTVVVPSIFLSSIITLTLVGVIAAVALHGKYDTSRYDLELFVLLGAGTAYFDQLTAPLLSLGLPLAILAVCNLRVGRTDNWPLVFRSSVAWFGAFALFWGAKWLIAEAIWGNVLSDVAAQLTVRTGADLTFADRWWALLANQFMQVPEALWPSDTSMVSSTFRLVLLALVVMIPLAALFDIMGVRRGAWRSAGPLLFIAAVPYVWFLLLAQHSLEHYYMTFRMLIVTTVSLFAFVWYALDRTGNGGIGLRLRSKGDGRQPKQSAEILDTNEPSSW